jgi:hypothetical protein
MPANRRVPATSIVLAVYACAAGLVTFPLVTRLITHFPGTPSDKDVLSFVWNNWWISYSVTELHRSPYFCDFIFAPFTVDLRLHTLGALYGMVSIPVTVLLGPVAALNVQTLGTVVLNGYSTLKLAEYVTNDRRAAFIAGLLVATTPAINFHLTVGRPSCAAVWTAVFVLYSFLRLVDTPNARSGAQFALAVGAMLAADQQVAMFGLLWLALLAGYVGISRPRQLLSNPVVRVLALAAIPLAPFAYWLYVQPFFSTSQYTVPHPSEALTYSYPMSLLWTPSMIWSVYGIVMPAGALAAFGVLRGSAATALPWLFGALFFISLSFGPVADGTSIPMPFALLDRLPGMTQFRTPYRFQIPAVIGLAVTVAVTLSRLSKKQSARAAAALFGFVVVVAAVDVAAHRAAFGFRVQTIEHEPVYEIFGEDPDDGILLDIPIGVRTGTDVIGPGEGLTFHQPIHRKRLINGFVARGPLAALDFYRHSRAILFLAGESPPPGDILADFRGLLDRLNVRYVAVHPEMLHEQRFRDILQLLEEAGGFERINSGSRVIAFRRESKS